MKKLLTWILGDEVPRKRRVRRVFTSSNPWMRQQLKKVNSLNQEIISVRAGR
jgi:hypothetical protein